MAGLVECDPYLSHMLEGAGRAIEHAAAELADVRAQLRSLTAEMHWRSAAATGFYAREGALADDVARLASRAQDAAAVAAENRGRMLPTVPWAC